MNTRRKLAAIQDVNPSQQPSPASKRARINSADDVSSSNDLGSPLSDSDETVPTNTQISLEHTTSRKTPSQLGDDNSFSSQGDDSTDIQSTATDSVHTQEGSSSVLSGKLAVDAQGHLIAASTASTNTVSTLTRPYLKEPLISRINRLLVFEDPTSHCYSARQIPENTRWGPASSGDINLADTLCIGDDVVTLWVVGEITYMSWADINSMPLRRVVTGYRPFFNEDLSCIQTVLARHSYPDDAISGDTLTARRWMALWNEPAESISPFTEYYDATTSWQGPDSDTLLTRTRFHLNDIVILELNIVRTYQTEPAVNRKGGSYRRRINAWTADLELSCLALLKNAPHVPKKTIRSKIAL